MSAIGPLTRDQAVEVAKQIGARIGWSSVRGRWEAADLAMDYFARSCTGATLRNRPEFATEYAWCFEGAWREQLREVARHREQRRTADRV